MALRRALDLYDHGHREGRRRTTFARYRSLEARVGAALAAWPGGFDRLAELERQHPRSSLAQLELGLAFFWQGRLAQARDGVAGRAEGAAGHVLRDPRRRPAPSPRRAGAAPVLDLVPVAAASSTASRRRSSSRTWPPTRGRAAPATSCSTASALQTLDRPVSAEREFAAAARLAPHDPDAQVAAAVGLFDKSKPAVAFSKLGPLVRVFPKAITVRFHLGLMLIWIGQLKAAKRAARPRGRRRPVAVPRRRAAAARRSCAGSRLRR